MSGGANPIFLFLIDFLALLVYTVNEGTCIPVYRAEPLPVIWRGAAHFFVSENRESL